MTRRDTNPDEEARFATRADVGEPVADEPTIVDEETRRASNELMAKFMRGNPRPAAPTPDHLSFSDGRPFVAYQAALRNPPPAAHPHITGAGVRVDRDLLASSGHAEESLAPAPFVVERERVTMVLPRVRARRYVLRSAAIALALLGIVGVAQGVRGSHGRGRATVAPVVAIAGPTVPTELPSTQIAVASTVAPPVSAPADAQPHAGGTRAIRPPAPPLATSAPVKPRASADPPLLSLPSIPEDPL